VKNTKEILIPVISLLIICVAGTVLMAFTDGITKDRIAENAVIEERENQKTVMPDAENFSEEPLDISFGDTVYTYKTAFGKSGDIMGYVFKTWAKGYSGSIIVMTGVLTDGTVSGVNILQITETPGLGMNAKNENFLKQYFGLSGKINMSAGGIKPENSIDILTGATITSKAVTDAVNTALELFGQIERGQK